MERNLEVDVLRSLEINFLDEDEENEHRDVTENFLEKTNNVSDVEFATALQRFGSVLLMKSQTPQLKKKKSDAVKEIIMHFLIEKGINMTEKQVLKKVNNMKSRIKTKTDKKATVNRKINLNPGEKIMYDLLGAEDNPAVAKVKYGVAVGVSQRVFKEPNITISSDDPLMISSPPRFNAPVDSSIILESDPNLDGSTSAGEKLTPPARTNRRSNETHGSRPSKPRSDQENLSTTQLQRMVLIKQLRVLEQEMRVNEKMETVLDKARTLLDRYL
ncbi:AAEL014757-PA [Aedes aegypti]|uniref:AAEL014757-PA n=2 Tax=Aedes aegypti TaxID=7159 RepID=A0A1S4G2I8_AEDAE|nr:uncharacterized protein LOC5565199 [Aedes aegypti]EAT32987.1 AAEL014757-PA [Aedes aegypti]